MFLGQYEQDYLLKVLKPLEEWQPFPPADDRLSWNKLLEDPLNQARRDCLEEEAIQIAGSPWPQLPASLYMDFCRNGDRERYQRPYFERRQRLATLVLAECMIFQGRFLDEIVNGIWCMLEELTWCIPAHALHLPDDPLPSHELESVDLFACETAMVLTETLYLLRQPLENLSPSLCERLRLAILNRVVVPVEERTDFQWLSGKNNWTPWCISNVLGSAMYLFSSTERLAALCSKLMASIDLFIENYGDDGGCDEGPGYWGVAPGAMLLVLEMLYSRSGGKIDIYDIPRVQRMGHFIVDAHLAGPWFMNFADAPARMMPRRAVVYRYGERIKDRSMQNLALLSAREWKKNGSVSPQFSQRGGAGLTRILRELFWLPTDAEPDETPQEKSRWLPDLQVLIAREHGSETKGFVLAAKGGHNSENHNHNDIGQFIIFLDGQPGVVDIGVETYCRETFRGNTRYKFWCIRSSGHNVPVINGIEQCAGEEFCAKNVEFSETPSGEHLAMNLENAYPDESGLISLRREFVFNRKAPISITVCDSFEMKSDVPQITLSLFCKENVELDEEGKLLISTGPRQLVLEYPADLLKAVTESVPLEDAQLRRVWGEKLYRIRLDYIGNKQADSYKLVFRAD